MGDRIMSDIIKQREALGPAWANAPGQPPRTKKPAVDIRDWLQQIDEGLVVHWSGGFAKLPLCNDEEELA